MMKKTGIEKGKSSKLELFNVISLVCDGLATHLSMAKVLGVHFDINNLKTNLDNRDDKYFLLGTIKFNC